MARQRAPGLYFERSDPPPQSIETVRTDVAGFVGVAERGPLHQAVRVTSWTQYRTRFGGSLRSGYLPDAVRAFFANGGTACWVVRVGVPPPPFARASVRLAATGLVPVVRVWARDFGPATDAISVRVERASGNRFHLRVRSGDDTTEVWSDISLDPNDPRGRYAPDVVNGRKMPGLDDPKRPVGSGDRTDDVLIGLEVDVVPSFGGVRGSVLIRLEDLTDGRTPSAVPLGVIERLANGPRLQRELSLGKGDPAVNVLSGLALEHFTGENAPGKAIWGLKAFEVVDEIGLVAMPDLMWPGAVLPPEPPPPAPQCRSATIEEDPLRRFVPRAEERRPPLGEADRREGQHAILRHCRTLGDRFAILDVPFGTGPDEAATWANALKADAGQYGALYYPWVLAPDLLSPDGAAVISPHMYLPPSGHVTGMVARVDQTVGVHKPPANERLEGVRGVEREITPELHGQLNDDAVNVIRAYPARGVRVFGARTLASVDQSEWRFVHVRRLLLMIEESIDQATQWTVFESNRPEMWRAVDRAARNFLDAQWRAGRLDGATPEEAFSVTCDATTNPEREANEGRFVCVITVAPPQPAEVVVVRLGRGLGDPGLVQTGRGTGG